MYAVTLLWLGYGTETTWLELEKHRILIKDTWKNVC